MSPAMSAREIAPPMAGPAIQAALLVRIVGAGVGRGVDGP